MTLFFKRKFPFKLPLWFYQIQMSNSTLNLEKTTWTPAFFTGARDNISHALLSSFTQLLGREVLPPLLEAQIFAWPALFRHAQAGERGQQLLPTLLHLLQK